MEFTAEELESELEPLIAQEIYVLLKLGKFDEATELSKNNKIKEYAVLFWWLKIIADDD